MKNITSMLAAGAAVGAAAVGGAAIANAAASATSSTSSGTPARSQPPPPSPRGLPAFHGPAPGTAAHENAEKAVTGTAAAKARAAAIKAVGGGKATEVTTDYTRKGYEGEVRKSNGTEVEVHLDGSFHAMLTPPGTVR